MFYFDKKLQYPVKVETPSPIFARMLQQAIGGIEGEIRVCMQYFFQGWGARGPNPKYRDMLLNTATEEMGHIEMLATAVAMNLADAPVTLQEEGAKDGVVGAIMGGGNGKHAIEGMLQRHILSTGLPPIPRTRTACPLTCLISTPAAILPPTCTVTSLPKRPVACSPAGSMARPQTPA